MVIFSCQRCQLGEHGIKGKFFRAAWLPAEKFPRQKIKWDFLQRQNVGVSVQADRKIVVFCTPTKKGKILRAFDILGKEGLCFRPNLNVYNARAKAASESSILQGKSIWRHCFHISRGHWPPCPPLPAKTLKTGFHSWGLNQNWGLNSVQTRAAQWKVLGSPSLNWVQPPGPV